LVNKYNALSKIIGKESDDTSTPEKPIEFRDSPAVQNQKQYFADLEKQYEVARATTHTQRGLGLGFSSATRIIPSATTISSMKPKTQP